MPRCKTDFAGLGGDSRYFRATGDARYYRELFEDFVGIARSRAARSGLERRRRRHGGDLRIVDQFFLGPSLVRGFAPSGIGPRDVSSSTPAPTPSAARPISAASLEVQFPIFGLPRELGLKGAVFADAGTLFGYEGPTQFDTSGNGILDGFAPTALRAVELDAAAELHRWSATARRSAPRSAPASSGRRRSARSASTTLIALTEG